MPEKIKLLLDGNVKWVETTVKHHPEFFEKLSEGQSPDYLWIGCSDSRVPATEITNTLPGSIFVHRNIANVVVHSDHNCLSVVYYAVKVLKVKHVIVCGHYGCGGVQAAMTNNKYGYIDNWLLHIKDVYRQYEKEIDKIEDKEQKFNRMVELNVMEQVKNLAKVSFVQEEWDDGQYPYIHGWVYNLHDGIIQNLDVSVNSVDKLEEVFKYTKAPK